MLTKSLRTVSTVAVAPILILIAVQGSSTAGAQEIPSGTNHAALTMAMGTGPLAEPTGVKASIGEVACGNRTDFFTTAGIAGVTFHHCYANPGDLDVSVPTGAIETGNNTGSVKYTTQDGAQKQKDTPEKYRVYPFEEGRVTVTHIHLN